MLYHGNKEQNKLEEIKLFNLALGLKENTYDLIARGHSHASAYYYVNNIHCLQVPALSFVEATKNTSELARTVGYNIIELIPNDHGYDIRNELKTFTRKK